MALIATKSFTFAGKRVAPGDRLQASPRHAKLLKAIGRAKDEPDAVKPQPKAEADEERAASKRGRYSRRDLTAES